VDVIGRLLGGLPAVQLGQALMVLALGTVLLAMAALGLVAWVLFGPHAAGADRAERLIRAWRSGEARTPPRRRAK